MRSFRALLIGTLTLRLSTSLTGTMLIYYLNDLPKHGGAEVRPIEVGLLAAAFFLAELVLAPPFGAISDRLGHHRVMEWGPIFGFVAVILTWATTHLLVLGGTRLFEGASTAASVPSILGYIAVATAGDVALRGRTVARFEAATLLGLGLGIVIAGPLYQLVGRTGFLLNAAAYAGSYLIYRFGVAEPRADASRADAPGVEAEHYGARRYLRVLTSSHVWLLAPTWIAVNACLGIVTTQTLFQLVRRPEPRFSHQLLMGIASPAAVSVALAIGGIAFFVGLYWWGNRLGRMRRTSVIFVGILGGLGLAVAAGLSNHSHGAPLPIHVLLAAAALAGVFVLAGATPAALGLLADISEAYPSDRGVIMGLYSVFLAIGQIVGSLAGGAAAEAAGIDGLVVAAIVLLAIAVVPLSRLRSFEHVVGTAAPDGEPSAGHGTAPEPGPTDGVTR